MQSFLFALEAVAPLVLIVAIGYALKRLGIFLADTAKAVNKIVFRILIPSTVFLNIYNIKTISSIDPTYIVYTAIVTVVVFLVSLPLSGIVTHDPARRGVISQVTYRSNYALIGLPLVESLCGPGGIAEAALLSVVCVSLYNAFAVISLSVFGGKNKKVSAKRIFADIIKNPLIISIVAALAVLGVRAAFVSAGVSFRLSDVTPVFTVLKYLSGAATPVALLCLGAQFEFSAIRGMKKELVFGVLARTVVVPLIGIGLAYLMFDFSGAIFAAFIAAFATPVSVSSAPMAQEMGCDATLAGQLVLWTTVVSSVTMFLFIYVLKLVNVF